MLYVIYLIRHPDPNLAMWKAPLAHVNKPLL
ncbi:hypothetical protein LGAS_0941 [Lactobacillus gasseri ATCC 33323 = JCM 1131]|uniref:Uncharacterized protein n=1 Tax=Lactobacillus gasseri (strain ATCC 33323 / DSM 20243 / BCRC 14619 / CIP 102991 / JCM 1131 / KCTC 3163 / NCIMB 11718 / NCTC 13722 / AM63) TaxID=324831 RepID=A0A805Z883_LACGA|nr:hypothetical protein LGAS_0941 [Lactobacillus gasseri ATCC 33323 = JCM 1131]